MPTVVELLAKGAPLRRFHPGFWSYPGVEIQSGASLRVPVEYVTEEQVAASLASGETVAAAIGVDYSPVAIVLAANRPAIVVSPVTAGSASVQPTTLMSAADAEAAAVAALEAAIKPPRKSDAEGREVRSKPPALPTAFNVEPKISETGFRKGR
jgi:hypothetical protein